MAPFISHYHLISLQKQANHHQQNVLYAFTVLFFSSWEVILKLKVDLKIIDILEFRRYTHTHKYTHTEQWLCAKWNYY